MSQSSTADSSNGVHLDTQLMPVVEEISARLQQGQAVDVDDYIQQLPDHADYLRQLVQTLEGVAALGQEEPSPAADSPPAQSQKIGEFHLIRQIGQGGMGMVFEAQQESLDRRVALKVLQMAGVLDGRQLSRFKNEARAAATLHHPHIVPVFAVGSDRGVHYYAMQYIDGPSLAEILRELRAHRQPVADGEDRGEQDTSSPNLSETMRTELKASLATKSAHAPDSYLRKVARWGVQAAEALAYAHENGVLHRDVKPANLLIDADDRLWIADFGLARIEKDVSLTTTGDLLGTIRYMSPEQALAKRVLVDHRSDIYSLGVTLYEMLTFQPAFPGSDHQELLKQLAFEDPVPMRRIDAAIPSELETIVTKAAAKRPDDRYDSAQDLAADLQRWLDHEPIRAQPPTRRQRIMKWSRRHPTATWSLAAALAVIGVSLLGSQLLVSRTNRQLVAAQGKLEGAFAQEAAAADTARSAERQSGDLLYAADVRLAGEALANNNASEARERLVRHVPEGDAPDRRGFAWRYLWSQLEQEEMSLAGHGPALDVAYSPDGELLAASFGAGKVVLYDAATGEELQVLDDLGGAVRRIDFSPDGGLVAGISDAGQVCIWHVADGSVAREFVADQPGLASLAFHPNGEQLATATRREVKLHRFRPSVEDPTDRGLVESRSLYVVNGQIHSIDISADGRWLAFGAYDDRPGSPSGEVWIYDLNAHAPVNHRHMPHMCTSVQFANTESVLAYGVQSGEVSLWDYTQNITLASWEDSKAKIYDLAFSADDQLLVAASKDSLARVYDLQENEFRRTLQGHAARAYAAAVHLHSNQIATASKDGTIKVWAPSKKSFTIQQLSIHPRLHSARFAPDGQSLVEDRMTGVAVHHLQTTDVRRLCHALNVARTHIGWSAKGRQFCLAGESVLKYRIDDSRSAAVASDQDGDGDIDWAASFGPTGDVVWQENLGGSGWAAPRLRDPLTILRLRHYSIDVDEDGNDEILYSDPGRGVHCDDRILLRPKAVALASADLDDDGDLDLVAVDDTRDRVAWYEQTPGLSGELEFTKRHNLITDLKGAADVAAADLNGDGLPEVVAVGWRNERRVPIFKNMGGGLFRQLDGLEEDLPGPELLDIADVDEDGQPDILLATNNKIMWSRNEGELAFQKLRPIESLVDAAWTRSLPQTCIAVYDAQTLGMVHELAAGPRQTTSVTLSPDGQQLAFVDDDEEIQIWKLPEKRLVHAIPYTGVAVRDIVFSPDGRRLLAAVGDDLRVWSTDNYQLLQNFQGHDNTIWCIAVSADNQLAATFSEDMSVRLWSLSKGRHLRTLIGHQSGPDAGAFSRDGRRLASRAEDGTVRIWDTVTGQQLLVLRDLVAHDRYTKHEDLAFCDDHTLAAVLHQPGRTSLAKWHVETRPANDAAVVER